MMDLNNLETLSRRNLNKFRTNLDAIIEKYSLPFEEQCHDVIDLETLTISSDRGQLRSKSYKSKTFGKAKLAVEHCLDLTSFIEDSAIGTSQFSTTLYELNTSESELHESLKQPLGHNTSFQNDILCELWNEEPEPSDAETLLETESDSWESDDEVLEKGDSSISKETSDDAESIPEEIRVAGKSENLEVDLPVSSGGVSSDGMINLCAKELSRSPVILRQENGEYLRDCACFGCPKVIAEQNTSPGILTQQSDLPKSGFAFQNFIHLMQGHTQREHFKAPHEVLYPRTVAIKDKITGQDTEVQAHKGSTGVTGRKTEPRLEKLCENTSQNQDVPVDDSDHSVSPIPIGRSNALITEELAELNHVDNTSNRQHHASEHNPGLSKTCANSRKPLDSTFSVMPSVGTDCVGAAKQQQHVLKNVFSMDDSLIKRRCHRSVSQKSSCLTSNLLYSSKSSSLVSVSETNSEICSKNCQVMTDAVVSSKRGKSLMDAFPNQPSDHCPVKSPNRFQVLSASDKPMVTFCDFIPCCSSASPVNLLPSIETNGTKQSFCLADSRQLSRTGEVLQQKNSVVPKVIPEKILPLAIPELSSFAAIRTGTNFNHPIMCNKLSSVAESTDLDDGADITDAFAPDALMVEKHIPLIKNSNLPSLTESNVEQSSLSDSCGKIAQTNFSAVKHAYTNLSDTTIETSACPKTPTQQIGCEFFYSGQQKARADSSHATFSPSECFAKMKLFSPKVSVTCVDRESGKEVLQLAGKVAKVNKGIQCSLHSASISYGKKCGILRSNVEERDENDRSANAVKEMEQWTKSSCADQNVWIRKQRLNMTEVSQGSRDRDVSMQNLNHVESMIDRTETDFPSAENLSEITSDTDEEVCLISLLSDVEEGKDEYGENNVISNIREEQVHEGTESEDAPGVTRARVTSTPTKDGSVFVLDDSFLSSISDSSEIKRIKELAMDFVFEEDLEETLIERTKIRSSVTAESTKKTNATPVTHITLTEEGQQSHGGQFEFLSTSDELQGIESFANFRQVAQSNKVMAKTGWETTCLKAASVAIKKFSANPTAHNMVMRDTDETLLKIDNITARNEGKMSNHQKEIIHKGKSFPIKEMLEINDADAIKTNLEMKKTRDNVIAVGKKEDRSLEECVEQIHPKGLIIPVSSKDAIQVRNRLTKTCTTGETVTPASISVKDNWPTFGDAVKCVLPPQAAKIKSDVFQHPSASCMISAPAKLCYSFEPWKRQRKSKNEKTITSPLQKAPFSKLDAVSVVSLSSPKSLLPGYLPNRGRNEEDPTTLQKTPKRNSDHCQIEQNRSIKRCRLLLCESFDNNQIVNHL